MAVVNLSTPAQNAVVNTLSGLFNAGSGPGTIKIYSGTIPTDANTAVGSQTLLVTITFPDPAFGSASAGAANAGTMVLGTAVASGTASWARFADSDGNVIFDADVGTAGTTVILGTSTTITANDIVSMSLGSVSIPASL